MEFEDLVLFFSDPFWRHFFFFPIFQWIYRICHPLLHVELFSFSYVEVTNWIEPISIHLGACSTKPEYKLFETTEYVSHAK